MSLASSIEFIYYTVYTANPEDPIKCKLFSLTTPQQAHIFHIILLSKPIQVVNYLP